jgi:Protein of unknown function (DUF2860)
MVQWAKVLAKCTGRFLLMRRGRMLAAATLLVVLSPQFGPAQEDVYIGKHCTGPFNKPDASAHVQGLYPAETHRPFILRGTTQPGSLPYHFRLAEKHNIIPEFSVNYDRAEGEAPHGVADIKLTYSYLGSPIVLMVNALIEYAGSDRKHQVFDKARSDERYSLATSVHYTIPWDWARFQSDAVKLFATGVFNYTDINLYKQESASGFAGLQLEW